MLQAYSTKQKRLYKESELHPTHPAHIMSSSKTTQAKKTIMVDGITCITKIHETYSVSAHKSMVMPSLFDRGANGGIAGYNVRVIEYDSFIQQISVQGINNHMLDNIPIVTVGGVVTTQHGEIIVVMHQYAHFG